MSLYNMPMSDVSRMLYLAKRKKVKVVSQLKPKRVAKPVKAYVKRTMHRSAQDKWVSSALSTLNPGAGVAKKLLTVIPTGDDQNHRNGQVVRNTKLVINYRITPKNNGTQNTFNLGSCKVAILWVKSPNGTAPVDDDMWKIKAYPYTQRDPLHMHEAITLYERFFSAKDLAVNQVRNQAGDNTYNLGDTIVKLTVPLKNRKTIFNGGAAGTIADIEKGAIYVYFFNDNTADAGYEMAFDSDLHFKEDL